MTLKDRAEAWIISHIAHPELLTDADLKAIDFLLTFVPELVKVIVGFSILTFIYLFLLKKYGFERTIVLLLVSIIFSIGQVGKAVRERRI
jgi:hypothetical protein